MTQAVTVLTKGQLCHCFLPCGPPGSQSLASSLLANLAPLPFIGECLPSPFCLPFIQTPLNSCSVLLSGTRHILPPWKSLSLRNLRPGYRLTQDLPGLQLEARWLVTIKEHQAMGGSRWQGMGAEAAVGLRVLARLSQSVTQ